MYTYLILFVIFFCLGFISLIWIDDFLRYLKDKDFRKEIDFEKYIELRTRVYFAMCFLGILCVGCFLLCICELCQISIPPNN